MSVALWSHIIAIVSAQNATAVAPISFHKFGTFASIHPAGRRCQRNRKDSLWLWNQKLGVGAVPLVMASLEKYSASFPGWVSTRFVSTTTTTPSSGYSFQ